MKKEKKRKNTLEQIYIIQFQRDDNLLHVAVMPKFCELYELAVES